MEGLQITAPGALEEIEKIELFDSEDNIKIKITRVLFVEEDFNTLSGLDPRVKMPIIPGRVAIGKIAEISKDNKYDLEKGAKVFLHAVANCQNCIACTKNDYKHCHNFKIAGKNTDGYLRNFAVKNIDDISILPPALSDSDAIFLDHVATADHIIDSINLQKGERVVIVGADVLGIILAQLIIYYQGIPILVDTNLNNLKIAEECGIYYTQFVDNKIEKYVSDLTSTHMAKKVVYMTGSNINTDIAIKLASNYATVCFAGFGTPNIRVGFNNALQKQLNFTCVTNGFDNVTSAMNIMVNKVIDTSCFKIDKVKKSACVDEIKKHSNLSGGDCCKNMLFIDID